MAKGMSLTAFIQVLLFSWLVMSSVPMLVLQRSISRKNLTRGQLRLLLFPLACPLAMALVLFGFIFGPLPRTYDPTINPLNLGSGILLLQVLWSIVVFWNAIGFRRLAVAVLLLELLISLAGVGAFIIAFMCAMGAGGA